MSYDAQWKNSPLGDIVIEWDFEDRGSSDSWSEPGDPILIYIEQIYSADFITQWYLPQDGYEFYEKHLWESEPIGEIAMEYDYYDYS